MARKLITGQRFSSQKSAAEKVFITVYLLVIAAVIFYPETVLHQQVEIAGIAVTPLAALAPVAFASFMWYFMVRANSIKVNTFDYVLLAALAYTIVRALAAAQARIEIRLAFEYAGYAIVAYYGAVMLFRNRDQTRLFIWMLVSSVMVVSMYEIFTFLIKSDPLYGGILSRRLPLKNIDFYRGGSTLGQPVYLGAFLLQTGPFALWMAFKEKAPGWRCLGKIALLLATVSWVLSFSKGAWIVGAVMALVMIWLFRHQIKKRMLVSILALVTLLAIALAIRGDLGFQIFEREEDPYFGRQWSWRQSLDIIAENKVLGVGLFRGLEVLKQKASTYYGDSERTFPVDNFYLSVFVEEGLIGAVFYGAVLAMILASMIKLMRRPPPSSRTLVFAIAFSLLGILGDAFIFDAFLIWPHFVLFWSICGLMRAIQDQELFSMGGQRPASKPA